MSGPTARGGGAHRAPVVELAPYEARALELWRHRHHLTPAQQAEVAQMPDPFRSVFMATELRAAGRRTEALLISSAALPTTTDPSVWRAHLHRIQAAVLADLNLHEQAVEANMQAQQSARDVGDAMTLATCLQDLATYPHQDDADHRDELLQEARDLARSVGADEIVVLIDYNSAWLDMELKGADPAVMAAMAEVEERARAVWPDLAAEARAFRARTAARAGDLETARELISELPDEEAIEDEQTRTAIACARAWVLADDDRVDEANDVLVRWLDDVSEQRRYELLTTLTEVLGHAGRYADAWRASRDLVTVTRDNAQSLSAAQARALEVWYRTRLAEEATQREQARAEELETALQSLSAAHEQIRQMSERDLLTGLYNRAYLLEEGARLLSQARPGAPVVIALADIDGFKRINDDYGHRVGDIVLQRMAQIAHDVLDEDDLVARYGGEEFVILRPVGVRPDRTLREDLYEIAERCRTEVFADDTGVGPTGVTLSGGIVTAVGGPFETVLHLADLRMYEAKRGGGDKLTGEMA